MKKAPDTRERLPSPYRHRGRVNDIVTKTTLVQFHLYL